MFASNVMNEFEQTADFTQGKVVEMKGHENDAERFADDVFKRRFSFQFQFLSRCLGIHGELFICYFMAGSCSKFKISPLNFLRESQEDPFTQEILSRVGLCVNFICCQISIVIQSILGDIFKSGLQNIPTKAIIEE